MTASTVHRARVAGPLATMQEVVYELLGLLDKRLEAILGLEDHELLALAMWTAADKKADEHEGVHRECRRRQAEYEEQANWFSAFIDNQEDMVAAKS